MQTLKDRDPQEFAGLVGLYHLAIEQVNAPDYERVAPPPQDKTPGALIDAWGLECFKLGFEMGIQLAQNE
ncbi:MAG: hypothetical protein IJW04_00725 [Ruminococcus sp.]|nr:hypothetical protein [Ruminococcus sp.]